MEIEYNDGTQSIAVAPEGVAVGETYEINAEEPQKGDFCQLQDIPEGTTISNIELRPNDGGKFAKSSGASAKVVNKSDDAVTVLLPSKQTKDFNPKCKALIGNIAGSGRTDKPFLKAGKKHYAMKARNRFYPIVSASSMNAVSHPFGNSRSLRKSKAKPAPRNAPPGRRVGSLRPKQQGRKR
jgi:large subunit ribosomal protein L2